MAGDRERSTGYLREFRCSRRLSSSRSRPRSRLRNPRGDIAVRWQLRHSSAPSPSHSPPLEAQAESESHRGCRIGTASRCHLFNFDLFNFALPIPRGKSSRDWVNRGYLAACGMQNRAESCLRRYVSRAENRRRCETAVCSRINIFIYFTLGAWRVSSANSVARINGNVHGVCLLVRRSTSLRGRPFGTIAG